MTAFSPAGYRLFLRFFSVPRRKFLSSSLLLLTFMAASLAHAATYTVTNTSDDIADTGSLRYALSQVNAGTGGDTINFSGVTGTITLASTLAITENVTINGPGANILAISGNDAVRIFNLATPASNVTISGLTITHGSSTDGAGILTSGVPLTVNNCTFSYNTTVSQANVNAGAAIEATSTGALTINNSTFFNNNALAGSNPQTDGGAIYTDAILVVNNSTFYNNSAATEGAAIWELLGSKVTIRNSTIVGNTAGTAGGGIWITELAPTITNSIISGNSAANRPDYACNISCGTTPAGNLIGDTTVAASLTPLQYNGGPTMTMAPLPGGTGIIGAGLNSTLATDQRGIPRPTAGASDLGAVQSYNLVVTTSADTTDPSALCDGSDTCSLRDALTLANSQGAGDVVTANGLTGTIALNSPLPDDTADLNINGPGANKLTLSAGGASSVLNITNPTAITNLSGLTIANGSASNGGGISNDGAQLTLANCAFTNNSAAGGYGGGLENLNPNGLATVTNCTFSGNTADIGGAIYNWGTVLVTNSTLSGNTATVHGGGLATRRTATVIDSTIANNTSVIGGGITKDLGTLTLVNDIVAANTETTPVGSDCALCTAQTAVNLISTAAAPITAAQLMLAPLGYYGLNQTVQTLLPLPGSPVIQAGDPTQLGALATDERQLPRTINGKLDLGAVQTNYTSVQFVQQPSDTTVDQPISPAVTMSLTESGTTVANVPLTVGFTGNGVLHGTLTESTVAPAVAGDPALAAFADLSGDTAGTDDLLTALVTVTGAGVSPAQTLTATSNPFNITQIQAGAPVVTVGSPTLTFGQPEPVTVTVPTTGGVPPTGTVTIYDNGNPIGTGTLGPGGTVTVTIPGGVLPTGPNTITAGYGGDGNYGGSTSSGTPVTVTPAVSVPVVSVGPPSPAPGQPVTVSVTVPTVGNTPATGTVIIYDNGNPIGTGTLGPDGTVTVSIPGGLPPGDNTITVGYSGGGDYGGTTSAPIVITALDFTLTRTSAASQTVIPGQTTTIDLQVSPTDGTYPGQVSFTATGLPAGATATFTPATVAANGGTAAVTLRVQTASQLSALATHGSNQAGMVLGLLLLPLLGVKRKRLLRGGKNAGRAIFVVLVLLAGAMTMAGLSGCGNRNGFFGQAPQNYPITITATSGTIQHSVNVTLNVQ